MATDTLVKFLYETVVAWKLPILVLLILLDLVFGVFKGLRTGTFDWDKILQFYRTMVGPWLLGYVTLAASIALIAWRPTIFDTGFLPEADWQLIAFWGNAAVAALIAQKLIRSLLANILVVFAGLDETMPPS